MTTTQSWRAPEVSKGVRAAENDERREKIIEGLTTAYWMEIETVMNYIAASINPDGVSAQEVTEALEEEIDEELGHARRFAERIKELWGVVPGSGDFAADQMALQPRPANQGDIAHVVRGVVDAERSAIAHYNGLIELCDGVDPVTQDLVIDILADEEGHLRLFEGFMRELEPRLL